MKFNIMTGEKKVPDNKNKQAGAELCQAQDKLGWPANSLS